MRHMARATLEGIELEYEIRGAGEPVVLVHAGLVAEWFQPLLQEQALTEQYQVFSFQCGPLRLFWMCSCREPDRHGQHIWGRVD